MRAEAVRLGIRRDRVGRPDGQAGHPPQLLERRARSADRGRRHARGARHRADGRPAAVRRPAVPRPEGDDEASLRSYIAANTQTVFHPTSSCAIGAVVDNDLRVMGVDGVRVCDASVMPTVVRGNTNAPVIAMAERAADLIRGRTTAVGAEAAPV